MWFWRAAATLMVFFDNIYVCRATSFARIFDSTNAPSSSVRGHGTCLFIFERRACLGRLGGVLSVEKCIFHTFVNFPSSPCAMHAQMWVRLHAKFHRRHNALFKNEIGGEFMEIRVVLRKIEKCPEFDHSPNPRPICTDDFAVKHS